MEPSSNGPILFYDGVCALCNHWVRFLLRVDKTIRFAPLQGTTAQKRGIGGDLETLIYCDDAGFHTRSDAILSIFKHLGLPWSFFYITILIPRPLRDFLYRIVARTRYRVFGKLGSCPLPSRDNALRFLP